MVQAISEPVSSMLRTSTSNEGSSADQKTACMNCSQHYIILAALRINHKTITDRSDDNDAKYSAVHVSPSQGHRCNRRCHCHYLQHSIASSSSLACPLTTLKIVISTHCRADDLAVVPTLTVYAEKTTVGREKEKTEWKSCLLQPGTRTTYQHKQSAMHTYKECNTQNCQTNSSFMLQKHIHKYLSILYIHIYLVQQ